MPLNVEAGGLWVQGWPVVYSKTMPQKTGDDHVKKKLRNFLWEAGSICTPATVSVCMFCPTGAVLRDPCAAGLLKEDPTGSKL